MMTLPAGAARAAIAAAGLGCAAVLVTACGAIGSTNAGAPSTGGAAPSSSAAATPSQSAAPSPTMPAQPAPTQAGGPPACGTPALRAAVLATQGGAAMGSTYYPVQFTNISRATCNLYGYPGVSFVSGPSGSLIGIPATENPAHPRQFVDLTPGQTVHTVLQVVVAQNFPASSCGTIVTAHWLRIYPPNQTAPLYASFTAQTCSSGKSTLSVETVQPGATGM